MAFEVPPLPYDYGALEPTIDEETMRLHHDKHHQAYVDNANAALAGHPVGRRPVEQVLVENRSVPEDKRTAVRNNAGGHANHSLFWEIMSPTEAASLRARSRKAIDDTFGGLDELKQAVNDAGVKRFGSGWSWLVWDGRGSPSTPRRTRTARSRTGTTSRCSGSTSGSTRTTSSTRTGRPSTSAPGGTSSTGKRCSSASTPRAVENGQVRGTVPRTCPEGRISCGSSCCSPRGSTEQPGRAGAPHAPAGRVRASP